MTPTISVTHLTRRYRDQFALDDVSVDIQEGAITGLLGRNGAGKSTLLRIIAGHEFASAGTVRVFGADPRENDEVLRRTVFIREDQTYPEMRVGEILRVASWFYPNWNQELADRMIAEFDLPPKRLVKKLSRGMRSAVGIVIGLAARAELTLFDEPYAGLDPVSRQVFYDWLLADYAEHPRTILLSTHLVDEVADLLERIVIVDQGRIVLAATADDVRGSATAVHGPVAEVEEFVADHIVWDRRRLASQQTAVIAGPLTPGDQARARDLHLSLEPLSLQQLLIHATGRSAPMQPKEKTSA